MIVLMCEGGCLPRALGVAIFFRVTSGYGVIGETDRQFTLMTRIFPEFSSHSRVTVIEVARESLH